MGKDLRNGESTLWFELNHTSNEGLSFTGEFIRESELTFENELVEIIEV